MTTPVISVVMPAHNAAEYLSEAVDSVLGQSFGDFELIIVDDASTDDTAIILQSISDSRLKVLRNDAQAGVARSLNRGIAAATGEFVARMDADDTCAPTRFAIQLEFFAKNPGVAICGTWVERFGAGRNFRLRFPVGQDCVRSYVLLGNPLAHPSVMFRREELQSKGLGYDEDCAAAQDYDLWVRASGVVGMDNIPLVLLKWRHNYAGVTSGSFLKSDNTASRLQATMLKDLGLECSPADMDSHRIVGNGGGMRGVSELSKASQWLQKLLAANQKASIYPQTGLEQACAFAWFRSCLNSGGLGSGALKALRLFAGSRRYRPSGSEWLYFLVRHILVRAKDPQGRPSDLVAK